MSVDCSDLAEKSQEPIGQLFRQYIECHTPGDVSRHLRCILLEYISAQYDQGFPVEFGRWLAELYDLFEMLDEADRLTRSRVN